MLSNILMAKWIKLNSFVQITEQFKNCGQKDLRPYLIYS